MRHPAALTCKVCGAPRARRKDGSMYSEQLCHAHFKEYKRSYNKAYNAKRREAEALALRSATDFAIPDNVIEWTIAFDVTQLAAPAPAAAAPAPRRRVQHMRPRRLHKPVRRVIVMPDFAAGRVVYLRGRVLREAPMPPTYGELKKKLLDHHQNDGYYIAQ